MNVAKLFATLGLKVDEEDFAKADREFNRLRQTAEKTMKRMSDEARHFDEIVLGISRSVRKGQVSDNIVTWGDATEHTSKRGARALEMWSNALNVWHRAWGMAGELVHRARQVYDLVEATSKAAVQADRMSHKTGLSVEAVQELGYAAEVSGLKTDKFVGMLNKLAKTADSAHSGSKKANAAFRQIGINPNDLLSGKLTPDKAIEQIADKFTKLADGQKKAALAQALFSKSGADAIPLLDRGAAGIQELRQRFRDLGGEIDAHTIESLKEFHHATEDVGFQLKGLRNDAVKAILPDLLELAKAAQAWIKANRTDIIKALTAAIQGLMAAMHGIGFAAELVIKVLSFLADHADVAKAAVVALTIAVIAFKREAIASWVAAAGPLAILAGLIYVLIHYFDDITAGVMTAFEHIGRMFSWLWDKLKAIGRGVVGVFDAIGHGIEVAVDSVKRVFRAVLDWIEDRIDWVSGKINWLIGKANKVLPGFMEIPSIPMTKADKAANKPSRILPGAGANAGADGKVGMAGAPSVNVGPTTINVNSPNADPHAVANAVADRMWDERMVHAAASVIS